MLLQNKSFLSCNGLRYLVGSANLSGVLSRNALGGIGNTKKNRYLGEASMYKGDATPSGLTPITGAWYPNRMTGGMSSRYQINGIGQINLPVIAGGLNGSVTMHGSGTIPIIPYIVVSDHFVVNVSSLTSLGGISHTSNMIIYIPPAMLNASISGGGMVTTASLLRGIAWCISDILSEGRAYSILRGNGYMQSLITSQGDLVTPQSCAQAVWEAVASIHNSSGTMGNKMNSASAAGDPWTAEIPGVYINGSAGATLEQIVKLVNDNQALILAK